MEPTCDWNALVSRRRFLAGSSAFLSFAAFPSLSFGAEIKDTRLLVLLLRGGWDGLAVMPPIGDPGLKGKRKDLIPDGLIKLDGFFSLHPAFPTVGELYTQGQALLVHAASFPYTGRSHFEGQNIMESGVLHPYASPTGWVGRALDITGGSHATALELPIPLILRGKVPAESHYPSWISAPPSEVFDKLAALWAADEDTAAFGAQLVKDKHEYMGTVRIGSDPDIAIVVAQAAAQLKRPDGPRVAVIDEVGFDTHAHQPEQSEPRFRGVDNIIKVFRDSVGAEIWKNTLVVTVTEFGRTAAENGSTGTDHGWGSCIFVVGGALKRSGVVADWPGLAPAKLYEGRDLKATIDARALYGTVVSSAFGIAPDRVRSEVIEFDPTGTFDAYFT